MSAEGTARNDGLPQGRGAPVCATAAAIDGGESLLADLQITSDFVINKWNHEPILQNLTHQHLEINFWIVNLTESTNLEIKRSQIHLYPMPKALQNFRDKFFIN